MINCKWLTLIHAYCHKHDNYVHYKKRKQDVPTKKKHQMTVIAHVKYFYNKNLNYFSDCKCL